MPIDVTGLYKYVDISPGHAVVNGEVLQITSGFRILDSELTGASGDDTGTYWIYLKPNRKVMEGYYQKNWDYVLHATSATITPTVANSPDYSNPVPDEFLIGAIVKTKPGGVTTLAATPLNRDKRLIDTKDISDSAINTAQIKDLNVTTGKLADSSVTTGKLADSSVTTGKLASTSINLPITQKQIWEIGSANAIKAGRKLTSADFTSKLGINQPRLLYNCNNTTNLGSDSATLTWKNTPTYTTGVANDTNDAIKMEGTDRYPYVADPAGEISTGSFGCWFRSYKTGVAQTLFGKEASFKIATLATSGGLAALVSLPGVGWTFILYSSQNTNYIDDRWHFVVATYDGASLSLYVDGTLEAQTSKDTNGNIAQGPMTGNSSPFNIGCYTSTAGAAANEPVFGAVDEVFVTEDILTLDQIRYLMAYPLAHGASVTPTIVTGTFTKKSRGPAYVTGDFPAQPKRLHNLQAGALTDGGSDNTSLAYSSGSWTQVPGPTGVRNDALYTSGSVWLQSSDTGLPATNTDSTMGCWFRTTNYISANQTLMCWGTSGNRRQIYIVGHNSSTVNTGLGYSDGVLSSTTSAEDIGIVDGSWHLAVAVTTPNSPTDGIYTRLYIDGKIQNVVTAALTSTTLAGANGFRLGSNPAGGTTFSGSIARAFVASTAYSPQDVWKLYNVAASPTQNISPIDVNQFIESVDSTNLYVNFSGVPGNTLVDLKVNSL